MRISVTVPSWHDTDSLATLLPQLSRLKRIAEVIVVDASDDPRAQEIVIAAGAMLVRCSAPNRGAQMNVGAMFASGDIVVFQHADTLLTDAHLLAIETAMADAEIIGGAFYRKFDGRHPLQRWLEPAARYLTRRGGTLFGDQSIFVRREVFLRLQGFAKIPLMEDVEFTKRLRAAGKVVVLDPPIQSSPRRHLRKGAWRASIQNGLFILLYKAGVSPYRLHRWYYRGREIPLPATKSDPETSATVERGG